MIRCGGVLLLLLSVEVAASEIRHLSITADNGRYTADMDVRLQANVDSVLAIVHDIDGLHRLSRMITHSSKVSAPIGHPVRRKLVLNACILFFCFHATLVEEIETVGDGVILGRIDPSMSDFRYGVSRWQVSDLGSDRSRVRLHALLVPAFWIPPMIGPWIIKRKLHTLAIEMCDRLERLATHGDV